MTKKHRAGKPSAKTPAPPAPSVPEEPAHEVVTPTSIPTWPTRLLARLKTLKGAIVAGVGAVLGGLAGFWNAYQAARSSMPSASSVLAIVGKGDAGPLSIVVLPFANLTGDPQQAYLADGIAAAVTADLSRIRDAFIVSTATAFAYRDKAITVQQIGTELGVRFALQGGVQRNGDKIRINAQLADTTSNRQLWAETFDGSQADLFALQELVTTRICNSIGRETLIVAARDSESQRSDSKAAELVLRAWAIYSTKPMTHRSLEERQALYRQALLQEPGNVQAMIGLAITLANSAGNGFVADPVVKEQQFVEARELALKAKERVPNDAQIYSVLAAFAQHHGDFQGAVRAEETALSLDPKTPFRYSNLADHYSYAGQPTRAIELLNQGIRLDPRNLHETILINMGRAQLILGDDDAAIQWLSRAVEANPDFTLSHAYLAAAYARKGDYARSRAAAASAMRVDPNFSLSAFEPPLPGYPIAYREFWETKLLPAARLAGLPD